jgi:hypothetical protein
MPCIAIKSKKYQTRKGPPYHANDCKGQTKKGNDGKEYVSVLIAKQKTYRWVPKKGTVTSTRKKKGVKTYKMLDNGGEPFVADVSPTRVEIFKCDAEAATGDRTKKVVDVGYKQIFIGDNLLKVKEYVAKGKYPGNSILIKVGAGKYIYAGEQIYEFNTIDSEDIRAYYSPVGNSAVPYPYAVGEKHTYFMLDKVALPNELLDLKRDGYAQFYRFEFEGPSVKKDTKKFKIKMIHKRVF